MARYTLYDLLNPDSDKKFKDLLSKYLIKSENFFIEKNQPSDDLLAKIYSLLHINAKTLESTLVQHKTIAHRATFNKQNELDFFKKFRIYCIVKALYIHSLTLDALKVYAHNKKIKKILAQLRIFIKKISAANHARLIADYEAEKVILDQRLREMTEALKYENMHAEAEKQMLTYFEQVKLFQTKINDASMQRDQLLDEHSENFYYTMSNFRDNTGKSIFESVPNEQLKAFAKDFEFQDYHLEKKIRNNQERENESLRMLEEIDLAIAERRAELSHQTKAKSARGVYATSMTTLLSMNMDVSNDPEIQVLTQRKNKLRSKVATLQSERASLIKHQKDLPLMLAKEYQLHTMVEILTHKNSEQYYHFINVLHHQREEKREQLQEQRLLRRHYRNQVKQIQQDANKLHEVDQNAKEIQNNSRTLVTSFVKRPNANKTFKKAKPRQNSLDALLKHINHLANQSPQPIPSLKH